MLKQQVNYSNNINTPPQAPQQDPLIQESCGDNNINNNLKYPTHHQDTTINILILCILNKLWRNFMRVDGKIKYYGP